MSRKHLCPGDFVFGFDVFPGAGYSIQQGLVVAIKHSRAGAHMGCEDRVHVMWSKPLRIALECDCKLQLTSDLVSDTLEPCSIRGTYSTG